MNIKIKLATKKDVNFFHLLRNDKKNRKNFFDNRSINFKNHKVWFLKKIKDNNHKFFKIILNKNDVGYLRFEHIDNAAVVSICIDRKFSGKGIGRKALILSEKKNLRKKILISKIKKNNLASMKMFTYAKYKNLYQSKKFSLFFKFF